MKRHMRLIALLAALTALLSFGSLAQAEEKMVQKVDNFLFFLDYSGSMNMKHSEMGDYKIKLAKSMMSTLNAEIPSLPYKAGAYTFAPYSTLQPMGMYNKSAMAGAIEGVSTDFDIFNRQTPMGNGLTDLNGVLSGLSGKTAVVMFTDGHSNLGLDPVAEAKALYAKYGSSLCIHIVSYADTAMGKMIIDEIRALSPCTVVADGKGLMDKATRAAFVKNVFYDMVTVAEPAPAPAPEETVITFRLNFGFDKYQITEEMVPTLEQVKLILEENPNVAVQVAGHTDSTGTVEYNQGLSERRAGSVKNWLVENGVSAARLEAVGYGELQPKYDNGTSEGRALNRRVEILNK